MSRPTFEEHDYFMKDSKDYTSRQVFQEHVRKTQDITRNLRDETKELQAQTDLLHGEMRDYHVELDEVIEGDLINTKVTERVEQKYNELNDQYNTELNGLTQQLAQTQQAFNDAVSEVTEDSEVILARGEYTTLGERLDLWDSVLLEEGQIWEVEA